MDTLAMKELLVGLSLRAPHAETVVPLGVNGLVDD
jgi:hypothetical protein